MGGSDFQGVSPYTYDDLPNNWDTDFSLNHFSIDKDRAFVLPIVKVGTYVVVKDWSAVFF